ncbi:MAG: hypothetical protein ABR929_15445 [Roseiarcus sp.]|jgi:hypothetical protein
MESLLCQIWHIPSGIATLIAGSFVIIGALIAWFSVQRQIRSAEDIEKTRRDNEIAAVESGFTAELLVYSRGVIQAASLWNQPAAQSPEAKPITEWPILIDPLYYKTNIGKIGVLRQKWVGGALIGFYANLLELNEQAKETLSGQPTVNATSQSIAARLRVMASNLSQALDGLNSDRKFPLQPELRLDMLFMPDGKPLSQAANVPKNLQEALLRLAGITPPSAA